MKSTPMFPAYVSNAFMYMTGPCFEHKWGKMSEMILASLVPRCSAINAYAQCMHMYQCLPIKLGKVLDSM